MPAGSPSDNGAKIVETLASSLDADVFVISATISEQCGNRFIEMVRGIAKKRTNAAIILTTNGGSADAAYQMARCIKRHYKKFILYVFGYCKSAGTLIAVASDEIIMSEFGQLGPLDVQLADKNEMFGQTPALDVSQSLATLSESSFKFFTDLFSTWHRVKA
jgi:ClpP class serine protease